MCIYDDNEFYCHNSRNENTQGNGKLQTSLIESFYSLSIHAVGTPQARRRSHCVVLASFIPVQSDAHVL